MPAHHITDITIENFRGFRKLELHGLKSVNLIVGANNTGKTSLLEAIALGCVQKETDLVNHPHLAPTLLFNDHRDNRFFQWLKNDGASEKIEIDLSSINNHIKLSSQYIDSGSKESFNLKFDQNPLLLNVYKGHRLTMTIVKSQNTHVSNLVDIVGPAIRKKNGEEILLNLLKRIDSRCQRIRIDPILNGVTVSVDLGHSELIPVSLVGQGFCRALEISARIITSKASICIIDEVEIGIHYSALVNFWRSISTLSKQLDVQIFATTHSRDCIEAAYQAMTVEDPEGKIDFGVVQLYRSRGEIVGRVLDEANVDMAMKTDLDLR